MNIYKEKKAAKKSSFLLFTVCIALGSVLMQYSTEEVEATAVVERHQTQSKSSACKWLSQYRRVSSDSLTLLGEMGGNYHDIRVPFPGQLYNWIDNNNKVETQLKFLVLTLERIIHLMDAKEGVQWNKKTLEHFLADLNRQSSELKECVAQYPHPSHKESFEKNIKRHFRKLQKILKKEKYSAQAWEKIRRAVKHHLQRMDIIASNAMFLLKV